MRRIIGLDFGSKTVGVAVSDPLGLTAQGVETVFREREDKLRRTLSRIEEICRTYGAEEIVLGLPRHMNGSEGDRAEKSRAFQEQLERRIGLPVRLWDERLTTVAAQRALSEGGVRGEDRSAVVDKIAAQLILQGYLDHLHFEEEQREASRKDRES